MKRIRANASCSVYKPANGQVSQNSALFHSLHSRSRLDGFSRNGSILSKKSIENEQKEEVKAAKTINYIPEENANFSDDYGWTLSSPLMI